MNKILLFTLNDLTHTFWHDLSGRTRLLIAILVYALISCLIFFTLQLKDRLEIKAASKKAASTKVRK